MATTLRLIVAALQYALKTSLVVEMRISHYIRTLLLCSSVMKYIVHGSNNYLDVRKWNTDTFEVQEWEYLMRKTKRKGANGNILQKKDS